MFDRRDFSKGCAATLVAALGAGCGPASKIVEAAQLPDIPGVRHRRSGMVHGIKTRPGYPYLLNVFGSWCGVCRDEGPFLLHLADAWRRPIFGLAVNDDDAAVRHHLASYGNPYSALSHAGQASRAIYGSFRAVPVTALIGRDGRVLQLYRGGLTERVFRERFLPVSEFS